MSAIGTKQTSPSALHMSAFDPKRTLLGLPHNPFLSAGESRYDPLSKPRGDDEAARVHKIYCRFCNRMAARGAGAAVDNARNRVCSPYIARNEPRESR